MPGSQHKCWRRFAILQRGQRLRHDIHFDALPFTIELLKPVCQSLRLGRVVGRQQPHTQHGIVQSPCGIDTRRQFIGDRFRRAILCHARHLLQRTNTAARTTRQLDQSFTHKPSILIV